MNNDMPEGYSAHLPSGILLFIFYYIEHFSSRFVGF